jgi:hypothetical protein
VVEQRGALDRDHRAFGDGGRQLRLRPAGRDSAQRDRVRKRIRLGAADGTHRVLLDLAAALLAAGLCALLVPRVLSPDPTARLRGRRRGWAEAK